MTTAMDSQPDQSQASQLIREILDELAVDRQDPLNRRAKWIKGQDGSYTVIEIDGATGLTVQF